MKYLKMILLLVSLAIVATGAEFTPIYQLGGNKAIDKSVQLNSITEWIATPGFGNGIEFFGNGCYAIINNFPSDKIKDDLTISLFFKVNNFAKNRDNGELWAGALFSNNYSYLGRVYSNKSIYGGIANRQNELKGAFSNDNILEKQVWNHYAITYSSKDKVVTLYLNGERVGVCSDNITPVKILPNNELFLGVDPDGCEFEGVIADFRVYDQALSARDVLAIAKKVEKPFDAKPNFDNLYVFVKDAINGVPIIPTTNLDKKYLNDTIKITATPEEYEPATFILRSLEDLKQVHFKVSDFTSKNGKVINADALDIKIVKCWYQGPAAWRNEAPGKYPSIMVPELMLNDNDLVKVDTEKEINYLRHGKNGENISYENVSTREDNDNFWQKYMLNKDYPIYDSPVLLPLDINKNLNQQFFLTFHAPENAVSGEYTGSIAILNDQNKEIAKLKVAINILPFTLPEARTYHNINKPFMTSVYYNTNLMDDDVAGITGYFRNKEQIRAELKNLKEHGVMYPTSLQLNAMEIETSKGEAYFREMLRLRKEAGLPNDPIHLISNAKINLPENMPATPENLQKLTDRATKIMNIVQEELNHKNVYFYGVDEAKGDVLKAQIPFFEAIRKAGAKTFCAGYTEKIVYPGNFVVVGQVQDLLISAGQSTREEAAKWHSIGHDIWCYAYPQSGTENPESYRRNFGLVVYKCNYDGGATFCYYMGFGHPWNDFDSTVQRDMNFVYPTSDGVVNTIAFEGYREGYDDIRYATKLLLECVEAEKSNDSTRIKLAKESREFLEKRDVYTEDLSATRQEIINRILKFLELKK